MDELIETQDRRDEFEEMLKNAEKMKAKLEADIETERVEIKYPKLVGKIKIISFCDAALNNMDDGVLSGGGYIVFLVDEQLRSAPIMWTSTKIKRVVRSLLAAEALIAVDCADSMIYIKTLVEEIMNIDGITYWIFEGGVGQNRHLRTRGAEIFCGSVSVILFSQ